MTQIRGIAPVFLVADVVRAAAYYTDKCGFKAVGFWGDPPTFCIAERDSIRIMLNQVDAGDRIHPNSSFNGRYSAYFCVNDADELFAEFKSNGAEIVCEPSNETYGMREFQVRDVDGHLLAFGRDIPEID